MPSATQTGVENPRRAALADIVKNRNEQLAAELKEGGASAEDIASLSVKADEPPADDPKRPADISAEDWGSMSDEEKGDAIKAAEAVASESETEEQKAERERKEAEAVASAEAAATPKRIKGKVDGKDVEFDEQAVIDAGLRTLQKDAAADRRLEEATKAREEAQRLLKVAEEAASKSAPAPTQKSDQDLMLAKEDLRPIVKKIQYGSEEEAAEALLEYGRKMAEAGQSGRLTASELQNILDLREAQTFVKTNYADVVGDPRLKVLFVNDVNAKIAAGDARPYQEICKQVGDDLRAWKAPATPSPTPTAGGRTAAAQARKVSTVSVTAAGTRLPSAPTETKAPSNSDLVEQARKARGQA